MRADFHIHSNFSDSSRSIEEILLEVEKRGLDVFSITDHDSVDGCLAVDKIANGKNIVYGIELSTYYKEKPVHILGYFYNNRCDQAELKSYLSEMKNKRAKRTREILKRLKEFYQIEIDYNKVIEKSHGVVSRPHIARAIMEKYGYGWEEIFERFLNNESKAYVQINRYSTKEGIELLHRNNAVAILAHPLFLEEKMVEEILEMGIDGLEVFYTGQNSKEYIEKYRGKDLLFTGGSDDHGEESGCLMGEIDIPIEYIEKFLHILGHQV